MDARLLAQPLVDSAGSAPAVVAVMEDGVPSPAGGSCAPSPPPAPPPPLVVIVVSPLAAMTTETSSDRPVRPAVSTISA
jgi:hypothetical protein